MLHKIYFSFLITLIIFLFGNPVFAKIETKHSVIYEISSNLDTEVLHNISISYDDKYQGIDKITLEEPTNDIKDLTKPILKRNYTLVTNDNKVQVKFNELLIGPISLDISYSYKTKSLIKKVGTTYSLEIPKVAGSEINEYNLKVYIPDNIPLNEYSKKIQNDSDGNFLLFTKSELENSGKYINFGKEIYYELSIKHLISEDKNYIVIPPTIEGRQETYIEYVSKDPTKIYKDSDGNLIFEYNTDSNTESISAKYLIKIYGNKQPDQISNYKDFLQPIKNWNFKTGLPLEITKKLIDSANPIDGAFYATINALQYNTNSISYDTNLRIGAENLNDSNTKNSVCLEYSDLLIAVLRGLGVPAREINGLNYKSDINYFVEPELHSWVEYYNNNNWTQVDPTFADTSSEDYLNDFDLFHIAFLRRSSNSEFPILTGSFAKNNIKEQLKINTVNIPNKNIVKIRYIDLFAGYYVINNSYNYINNISPKSSAFINKGEFLKLKNYSNIFIKLELDKAPLSEVLLNQKDYVIISFICVIAALIIFFLSSFKS